MPVIVPALLLFLFPRASHATTFSRPELHALAAIGSGPAALGQEDGTRTTLPECISCESYLQQNPQFPELPWYVHWSFEQCEDGYSPSGPCVPCEGDPGFCDEREMDASWDICSGENCSDNGEYAAAAAAAVGRNDNRALEALVADHPRAFRIEAGELALIAADCRERVLHRFPLAAPLFSARD